MNELKKYAAVTSQGPYLQINEDDHDIDLANRLFSIFDGFGGAGIGDKSVALAKETIRTFYTKIGQDPDSTLPFFFSPKYLVEGNSLINAMNLAHDEIKKSNEGKEMSNRGGVSALCAAMSENIMTFASTGNCQSYLYRKGFFNVLTYADCLSSLSKDDYDKQFHTAPMSGVGLFDDLQLQIRELRVQNGDIILMITDGVYSRLEHKELKYIIEQNEHSLKQQIGELFKLANERGNRDNQTGILLKF